MAVSVVSAFYFIFLSVKKIFIFSNPSEGGESLVPRAFIKDISRSGLIEALVFYEDLTNYSKILNDAVTHKTTIISPKFFGMTVICDHFKSLFGLRCLLLVLVGFLKGPGRH